MSYNLFIDDERSPFQVTWMGTYIYQTENWIIARSIDETIELIDTFGFPNVISFDHDLGKDKPTGHDIAKALIQKYEIPFDISYLVHSKNPVGAENIKKLLDNYLEVTYG